MTVLSWPSILYPAQVQWRLRPVTQIHLSPFDGTLQTLRQSGADVWVVSLSWPKMSPADARELAAFLARLGGRSGRFYFSPSHEPRQATGTGTPVINGSSQSGASISIRGWTPGEVAFKRGDWLSYPDGSSVPLLHQVIAQATANGSGVASVQIAPPVRRSVADGTAVEIASPVGQFRLAEDEVGVTRQQVFGSAAFDIVEVPR